ncbi:TPR end-of-group domain-containing protein [Thermophagus sp. OGC60D27]|uniref:TPR end-of-group domain-containing protein n=1 Tax=Thermophagus sp. OGC60D27 TaxID=3458415 RepID=UPI0040379A16
MKRTRINLFATVTLAALLASCSGLDKMKDNAPDVKYTVTPEVLEAHGGKVPVTIKVQIPGGYFDKKTEIEATPVLVYEGGETAYAPYRLQGESVDGNAKVISYSNGGQFTYEGSVDYNENMRVSDLVVRITATKGETTLDFEPVKIAEGVIATSQLMGKKGTIAALGEDHFQRITPEVGEADIHFLIQRSNVRRSELTKEDVKTLEEFVKASKEAENKSFKNANISSYASPDGPIDLNTRLAEQRQNAAKKYLDRILKKNGVEGATAEDFFELRSTPEDWEGFKELVQNSDIEEKDLILRVLSTYSDPEVRESEMKNMAATYKVLAEKILPQLRRSVMKVNVEVMGKSDAEISELAATSPADLNLEEILYAATLTNNLDDQLKIYKAALNQHSNCWRAQNNIGVVLFNKGDVEGAKGAFEKANSMKANEPVVLNNLGVIALYNDDVDTAKEYFDSAAGAGAALDNNLGVLALYNGNYDEAVRYFGNATTSNAALAKLLNGNYDSALATLNAIDAEVGLKHYLKAIIGARQNDTDMLFAELRKAVELDSSLKELAATDMEFGRYFEDASFKQIVQ